MNKQTFIFKGTQKHTKIKQKLNNFLQTPESKSSKHNGQHTR